MPAQTEASIPQSFRPPPPVEKTVGPDLVEGGPQPGRDWTTTPGQSASGIAAGAKGERAVVSPEVQQMRRDAGWTAERAARS